MWYVRVVGRYILQGDSMTKQHVKDVGLILLSLVALAVAGGLINMVR